MRSGVQAGGPARHASEAGGGLYGDRLPASPVGLVDLDPARGKRLGGVVWDDLEVAGSEP
ncbi:hypothetical protein FHS96_005753 [Sphingomonas zeicaulis]|uniref:hypothetical protein n=1 Tax=Sphingomonas zeicaulis TaxID=1632740 RepID=UPI003D19322E